MRRWTGRALLGVAGVVWIGLAGLLLYGIACPGFDPGRHVVMAAVGVLYVTTTAGCLVHSPRAT